ncbi:MAG: glutamine amidotransferase, partial [Bradymonadaceae bacterium]
GLEAFFVEHAALTFEFVPKTIGKEVYTVEAPEFSGEALHQNNVSHFLQNVIRDKIRVLQVVGQPSWDERFLRRLMKKNPNVDLISFFILRTNSNVQLVPPDELSLIPFPTRELFEKELGSFDLVIFQNFNFGPYNMDRYLDSIAQYVRDGGAFAMLGGNLSFASGGYGGTPIEDILPVKLPTSRQPSALLNTEQFRPDLTEAGTRHPITQMAFDPQSNRKIWKTLPKLRGTNVVRGAKPDATVLAEHPTIRRGGKPMPVLTVSEKGDGRVMALTSDSTWRWGFSHVGQGGTPREYQVFWNSAMRWLIKDPELKLIRVDIPEETVPPGESIRTNIQVSKPDYTPAKDIQGTVKLRHQSFESLRDGHSKGDGEVTLSRDFNTDHSGQSTSKLPAKKPGIYTVEAKASTDAGDLSDREVVLSVPDVREFRHIVPRDDLMASIADHTGGHSTVLPSFDPDDLKFDQSSRVRINRRKVIHLWDSLVVFVLIVSLLGTEWTLRRRWGRL